MSGYYYFVAGLLSYIVILETRDGDLYRRVKAFGLFGSRV